MSQLKQAGRDRILPCSDILFYSVRGLDDAHPHWGGQSTLLNHQLKCSCQLETTSQTRPEIMFNLSTP